ncbi:MAG TPA: general secretion pathway protein GspB [Gammaproteobacteria bacterium]|nr:general secretion pathway protein GspB [Gammaproteobacteria bacterium]
MSLILDALRKSERTRQQSLTGQLGSGDMPAGPSRLPVPWLPLIAAILAVNALVLYFLWPHTAPLMQAPAATPLPASSPYRPTVRSLASEAISPDEAPASPARPIPVPAPVSHLAPPGNPSTIGPQAAQSAPVAAGLGALQSIDELPPEIRQALPALHMDVHGYAAKPADRFVVINLKTYRIGDTLAEGPVLRDIVPQGAVLEFHGVTFLLPP